MDYEFRSTLLPLLADLHTQKTNLANSYIKKPKDTEHAVATHASADKVPEQLSQLLAGDYVAVGLQNILQSILTRQLA
ncbi:hypothetical protein EON65_51040 [archaeon]|nr:MAG: hypothetical protein EON65_51040 [archaeon]